MAVYSKHVLSGLTNGIPLAITGTAPSTANTLHTAVTDSGAGQLDEIYVYAFIAKGVTTDRELYIRFGVTGTATGVTGSREITHKVLYNEGLQLVVPGIPLNNAQQVQAYATANTGLSVVGYVNRVT